MQPLHLPWLLVGYMHTSLTSLNSNHDALPRLDATDSEKHQVLVFVSLVPYRHPRVTVEPFLRRSNIRARRKYIRYMARCYRKLGCLLTAFANLPRLLA